MYSLSFFKTEVRDQGVGRVTFSPNSSWKGFFLTSFSFGDSKHSLVITPAPASVFSWAFAGPPPFLHLSLHLCLLEEFVSLG